MCTRRYVELLTVHPFPRSRCQTRFFLGSDPDQLGLEPGFAAFKLRGQKRRRRSPEPVHDVSTGSLTLLPGVRERRASIHVELVTPVVEHGHVYVLGRTSWRATVHGKFYAHDSYKIFNAFV